MSNFAPAPRHKSVNPYGTNAALMEGAKASFTASLLASQTCMTKCNLTDASPQLSGQESECLRQCFVKYFDAQLVIQNEMTNFARGLEL